MPCDRFCKRGWLHKMAPNVMSCAGHKTSGNMEINRPRSPRCTPRSVRLRRATHYMKQDPWLLRHAQTFSFLGGAPPASPPPDNLRTGGTARPRAGNPVLNGTYEELVVHHRSAIISAKVSYLKQKPRNEVWADATYAATTLRDAEVIDITALRVVVHRTAEHKDTRRQT